MSAVSRIPFNPVVDTSQPIEEPVTREQIIEDAAMAIFDRLDALATLSITQLTILRQDIREAAGRSPSDDSNERIHRQPERFAATMIASTTRQAFGQYPECWDEDALNELLRDIPNPPIVVPFDVRIAVTGKLASMWREVSAQHIG